MALKKFMADGTEGVCYICGHEFKANEIIIAKPGARVNKATVYVCSKARCNPSSAKTHHVRNARKRTGGSRRKYRYN